MRQADAGARLRAALQELETLHQELADFSYSVSHDLRAPLRHIDGFARLLEAELGAPGGKAGRYLATIGAAARRMDALLEDLLQFSRAAREPLAPQRVEPAALVQALIREAAGTIGERRVEWVVDELPAVTADPALLRTVLRNLLSNALKFTRAREPARIEIRARRLDGGAVELQVRDNGAGFDMQFAEKLFGVFQRLHDDEEFEGRGIGLATARRILHRHGQRIRGEGAPQAGAAFTFTMPAAD
ncbi:MAG TPA: ATP-binding protein [Burkholderiales bacterium]|nr:ATP-binding protein [Burkholderiales bacterium]